MRLIHAALRAGAVAAAALTGAGPADAGSAVPWGMWSTAHGEEMLYVGNGGCAFGANGQWTVSGSCRWNASSAGGILTIRYYHVIDYANVYFNVLWQGRGVITVEGDYFYRQS